MKDIAEMTLVFSLGCLLFGLIILGVAHYARRRRLVELRQVLGVEYRYFFTAKAKPSRAAFMRAALLSGMTEEEFDAWAATREWEQ